MLHAQIDVAPSGQALTAHITFEILNSSSESGGYEYTLGEGDMVGTRQKAIPAASPLPWATPVGERPVLRAGNGCVTTRWHRWTGTTGRGWERGAAHGDA